MSQLVDDAVTALTQLGFRQRDARAAVVEAATHVGSASLEDLIRRALPLAAAAHRVRGTVIGGRARPH